MKANVETLGCDRFKLTVEMDLAGLAGLYTIFKAVDPVVISDEIGHGDAYRIFAALHEVRGMYKCSDNC